MTDCDNDFATRIEECFAEIVASKALAVLEPEAEVIRGVRLGQARYISTQLARAPDDSFIKFPNIYGRHTTLAGVWMFLEKDHQKEYLVSAFGRRKGDSGRRPAEFEGLHVSHGSEHSVQFSKLNLDYLEKHVENVHHAEILICHNHPRNLVSDLLSLIDWSPLPSNTDRETMYQFKHRAVERWLASVRFQSIRFYLVEDGRLREIQLPSTKRIASLLKREIYL